MYKELEDLPKLNYSQNQNKTIPLETKFKPPGLRNLAKEYLDSGSSKVSKLFHNCIKVTPPDFGIYLSGFPVVRWLAKLGANKLREIQCKLDLLWNLS